MAQNLFGPSSTPNVTPQATPSAPSQIVSGTRTAARSVFGFMGNHKGKLALLAGGAALVWYAGGISGVQSGFRGMTRGCSSRGPGAPMVMPFPAAPGLGSRPEALREDAWQAGVNLVRQADQVDIEWRAAIDHGDRSHDSEFINRRNAFSRESLDQYAISLGKRSDETWEEVIRRHYRDMDIMRIRQVAFSLWRVGDYEQARSVMNFFFYDGRWRDLSNDSLCAGLDLAFRENMLTWNSFSREDNNEFERRCHDTIALRVPTARR